LLTEKAIQEANQPSFTPYRPEKVIGALGLNAIRSVALSVHQTEEGSFFNLFLSAPETEREGLLKILAGECKETAPPPFVPADVVKFYRWRMDGQKTWTSLEKMLNTVSPQLLVSLNFAFEMAGMNAREKDPDYDLKKNFLASLGNDIIGYQKNPRSTESADLAAPPSLFLLGSPQPEKLIDVLKNIMTAINRKAEPPKEREFLGRKIYSFQLAPSRLPGGERKPRTLEVSASSSYLALSMDAATLEEFLRSGANPAKPLRGTPGFTDAVQKVTDSGTSWLNYENQNVSMRMTFDLLKKSADRFSTNSLAGPLGSLNRLSPGMFIREWVDLSLLPDFDRVSKYFYFTVSSGNASAEGLSLKMFSPRPPQLRE
jgi:hypothetical protein